MKLFVVWPFTEDVYQTPVKDEHEGGECDWGRQAGTDHLEPGRIKPPNQPTTHQT